MRVLGIDPGYERLGVAVMDGPSGQDTLLYSTCIQTSPRDGHDTRLAEISRALDEIITGYEPDCCALETLYFNTNQKTAMKVAEARGVVIAIAARAGCAVHQFTPPQIKVAITGHGQSRKDQVTEMVCRLVRVPSGKRYDDEYDAIAVALTALASINTTV